MRRKPELPTPLRLGSASPHQVSRPSRRREGGRGGGSALPSRRREGRSVPAHLRFPTPPPSRNTVPMPAASSSHRNPGQGDTPPAKVTVSPWTLSLVSTSSPWPRAPRRGQGPVRPGEAPFGQPLATVPAQPRSIGSRQRQLPRTMARRWARCTARSRACAKSSRPATTRRSMLTGAGGGLAPALPASPRRKAWGDWPFDRVPSGMRRR
jgi:hypothetical protein